MKGECHNCGIWQTAPRCKGEYLVNLHNVWGGCVYWGHIKSFAIRSDCEPLLDWGAGGGTPFQSEIWIIYKISWSAVLGIYTTLKLRQRTESAWNHLKSELESEADQPLCLSFAKFPPALSFIGDSQKLYSTSQLSICRIYLDAFSKLQIFQFTNRSLKS